MKKLDAEKAIRGVAECVRIVFPSGFVLGREDARIELTSAEWEAFCAEITEACREGSQMPVVKPGRKVSVTHTQAQAPQFARRCTRLARGLKQSFLSPGSSVPGAAKERKGSNR